MSALGHLFLNSERKVLLFSNENFMLVFDSKESSIPLSDGVIRKPVSLSVVGETFDMVSYEILLLNGPPFINKYFS